MCLFVFAIAFALGSKMCRPLMDVRIEMQRRCAPSGEKSEDVGRIFMSDVVKKINEGPHL
jgi:hypothetical protein